MRTTTSVTLSAALLACAACSDPECGDNEQKVGKTCFPITHSADAATPATTGQPSASTGHANINDAGGGGLPGIDGGSGAGLDGGSSGIQSPSVTSDSQAPVSAPDSASIGTKSEPVAPTPCDGGLVNVCNSCDSLKHAVGEVCSNDGQGPCALMGTYQCFAEQLLCNAPKGMAGTEVCDGIDNDCNGKTDEGLLNGCKTCGTVPIEVCDGVDNNCDGRADEGVLNACGACGPVPVEVCDAVDNDCDGQTDDGVLNACGQCGPVPVETCDAVDNDCDGQIDEADAANGQTWYPDCDGDGYAALSGAIVACKAPAATMSCKGYLNTPPVPGQSLDCNDLSTGFHPGALYGAGAAADVDCDGMIEVADYVTTIAPGASSGTSHVVPYCPAGQEASCKYCGDCAPSCAVLSDPRQKTADHCSNDFGVSASIVFRKPYTCKHWMHQ